MAASTNGHGISPRVAKSIERAALDAAGEPEQSTANELHDRIIDSLRDEAGTVTELGMRLDVPRGDIATAVEALRDAGSILECGIRPPRGHKVYGVAE